MADGRSLAEFAAALNDAFERQCRECTGTPRSCVQARIKCCPDCTHTARQRAEARAEMTGAPVEVGHGTCPRCGRGAPVYDEGDGLLWCEDCNIGFDADTGRID